MYCSQCRTQNLDDAKFCISCGAELARQKTPPESKSISDSPTQGSLGDSPTTAEFADEFSEYGVGDVIAYRYEVLELLGRGGMGEVYKVLDKELNETIALKLMSDKLMESGKAVERFRQELKTTRELRHPNIVKTYEFGDHNGRKYFTMEYVEGKTLRELLDEKSPSTQSLPETLHIINQICDALAYAHQYTVHRDIKPENILITSDNKVKLTDFGIAKVMSKEQFTATSMRMGTPYYMAPEQLSDAGQVDRRADVFGVGVVLYEMLTGEVPIGRFKLPGELIAGLPENLDDVVGKSLEPKSNDRFSSIKNLKDALDKVVTEIKLQKRKEEEDKRRRDEEEERKIEKVKRQANNERIAGEEVRKKAGEIISGLKLVFIKGGTYEMGDNFGDGDSDEKPVHTVRVDGFYLSETEVTQAYWESVMGNNPSYFKGADRPVDSVSWNDVQEFIKKLNQKTGKNYRLPTEAEWEYAAREGGKKMKYSGTNSESDLGDYAWFDRNSENQTHLVKTKRPNAFVLYDMSGNVWEWCQDRYDSGYYKESSKNNPKGPSSGWIRVLRGGSWDLKPRGVRSSKRSWYYPGYGNSIVGFRLAR